MRKWLPLLTVCLGTFMLLIDVTIVNVALPDMTADLKASFGSLQWVVDAYALVLAALVLGTGSIADLIGHRRAYVGGLALFALASLVCGISQNSGELIAARAVQGVGAAAMFATTFALLNSNYSGRDRGTAYGIWGAVTGAAAAVGPIIGGLLTEGITWRWIFFVNLPISVAAIALCVLVLKDTHDTVKARVDVLGILTFSAAAAALTYGLIKASDDGWSEASSWGWLVATPVLLALFAAVELRSDAPMLDLSLLRSRKFVGVLIAGMFVSLSAFAALTYTSIWLQSVLGMSPIEAGLTGLPLSLAAFAVSAGIGRFLHDRAPGPIIGAGLLLIGLGGLVGAVVVHGDARWLALFPGYALIGIGAGLATPTLSSAAMSSVPIQRGGMAAGAVNTARQLGLALGIALLGSVFASRAAHVLAGHRVPGSDALSRAVAGGESPFVLKAAPAQYRGELTTAVHSAAVGGVQYSLLVSGVLGVLAGLVVLVLMRAPKPAGAHEPEALGTQALSPAEVADAV